MVTSSFELEKILDYKKNTRNKWYFLCRWKGFGPEEDKWEPASSFIHGYTDTFIRFLKKHPEIDKELSLIKDCVTKEDLQAQEEAPIETRSDQNLTRRNFRRGLRSTYTLGMGTQQS